MCVAEACHLILNRKGPRAEAEFLRSIAATSIEAPTPGDIRRMADLCDQYRDFPLGGTDASIVALAERLDIRSIITLDRRHFSAVRPDHCPAFEILPE
jgi:hypothetical protein